MCGSGHIESPIIYVDGAVQNGMNMKMTIMSNETYHVLGASIRAAELKLGNGVIIVIRNQKRGKTHTLKAIKRNNPGVTRIVPGTETAIYEQLKATEAALIYYMDDRDRWSRDAFMGGLRYGKGISDGDKAPLQSTHYTAEAAQEPEQTHAWFWVFLNKEQYDAISPTILSTGLKARSIFLKSKHTAAEQKRIKTAYKRNKWNNHNIPKFKIYDDWYNPKESPIRKLTVNEESIIETTFTSDQQDEITKIAQVMSKTGFEAVLKILQVSGAGEYYEETIEFYEPDLKRNDETNEEWEERMIKEGK
jgi:hypothetical protein